MDNTPGIAPGRDTFCIKLSRTVGCSPCDSQRSDGRTGTPSCATLPHHRGNKGGYPIIIQSFIVLFSEELSNSAHHPPSLPHRINNFRTGITSHPGESSPLSPGPRRSALRVPVSTCVGDVGTGMMQGVPREHRGRLYTRG